MAWCVYTGHSWHLWEGGGFCKSYGILRQSCWTLFWRECGKYKQPMQAQGRTVCCTNGTVRSAISFSVLVLEQSFGNHGVVFFLTDIWMYMWHQIWFFPHLLESTRHKGQPTIKWCRSLFCVSLYLPSDALSGATSEARCYNSYWSLHTNCQCRVAKFRNRFDLYRR